MKTIIMLKGLPASGKTTWAKEQLKKYPGRYKRVNKDDLRAMLDNGKWSSHNEKFILKIRDEIIRQTLVNDQHVIIDDTNFHPKHHDRLKEIARLNNACVKIKEFNTSIEECIERDSERENSVGEKVIRDMYDKYLKKEKENHYKGDENLPSAFIFDVDGTLARMVNRGPYDWDKVKDDEPNQSVVNVLKALKTAGYAIIICTGRDGVCLDATKKWLAKYNISYDDIHIRAAGDTTKDANIKRIMLSEIEKKYNVLGVFDDRDQVVKMWRSLGIRCFQVDYGDF